MYIVLTTTILAIRVATQWYNSHLKTNAPDSNIEVVMLTDDRQNREKAKASGVKGVAVVDYVENITDTPELMDMLSAPKAAGGDTVVYDEVSYKLFNEASLIDGRFISIFHLHKFKIVSRKESLFKAYSMLVNTMCTRYSQIRNIHIIGLIDIL
jgi:hypothetical protein